MAKYPTIPWPIRVVALLLAAGLSLYLVEIYVFGAKFTAAVAALARPAPKLGSEAAFDKKEQGVVPVRILSTPAK